MAYMKDFALKLEEALDEQNIYIGAKEALEKIEIGAIDLGTETNHIKNHFNKIKENIKNA